MTKRDQKRIVREMSDTVRQRMIEAIESGKVPENWDGFELRKWMLDIVREDICYVGMTPSRLKDYHNDRTVASI